MIAQMPPHASGGRIEKSPRVPSLDGLRCVAIVLVLVCHTGHSLGHGYEVFTSRILSPIAILAVKLFFVISGFIITTLMLREQQTCGSISMRDFYRRRVYRILPALYVYIGFVIVLELCGAGFNLTNVQIFSACAFTTLLIPWGFESTNAVFGHLWSLAAEEQFYILWPTLMAFGGTRRAVIVGIGFIVVSPIARTICYSSGVPTLLDTFVGVGDIMMFGCLAAFAREFLPKIAKVPEHFFYRSVLRSVLLIVPISLAYLGKFGLYGFLTIPFSNSIVGVCFSLLLLSYVNYQSDLSFTLLNSFVMVSIGKLSYSLYLWQQLFLMTALTSTAKWWQSLPVNLVLCIFCATISYYFIECPALLWRIQREQRCLMDLRK